MEDLAAYHNEIADVYSGHYPVIPLDRQLQDMAEAVTKGTARIEAVVRDGTIAGFCEASHGNGHGEVDLLYLDASLRGRGLGTALLESALAYLKENGVRLVDLRCILGNPAREFYQRHGFQTRSEIMSIQL